MVEQHPGWPAYIEQAFRLADSTSPADAGRFMHVRDGFMAALVDDPRVAERLTTWAPIVDTALKKIAAGGDMSATPLIDEAFVLVRDELQILWPWAALELTVRYVRRRTSDLTGHAFAVRWRVDVRVPSVTLADPRPRPGETITEAKARILSFADEAISTLEETERSARRGRRAPKGDGASLHSWGRWFYEAKILKSSRAISHIARHLPRHKNHADLAECGCRNDVRTAIAKAKNVLALSDCTWETLEGIRRLGPSP